MRCWYLCVRLALMMGMQCLGWGLMGQSPAYDESRNALAARPEDTSRVLLLCDEAWEMRQGPADRELMLLVEALQLAKQLHYARGLGLVHVQLGGLYLDEGKYELAESALQTALYYRRSLRDTVGMASVYNVMGELHFQRNLYRDAERALLRSLGLYASQEDTVHEALVLRQLTELHSERGDFVQSQQCGMRALWLLESMAVRDSTELGKCYSSVGSSFFRQGMNAQALSMYAKSRTCLEAMHNEPELARVLNNLGSVAEAQKEYPDAHGYYTLSMAHHQVMHDTLGTVTNMRNIARIYRWLDDYRTAIWETDQAINLLGRSRDEALLTTLEADRAELNLWLGDANLAMRELGRLQPMIDSVCRPGLQIYYRHIMSIAAARTGDLKAAAMWNRSAVELNDAQDREANGGAYLYGKYLEARNVSVEERARNESLRQDLEIAGLRSRQLWLLIVGLALLLGAVLLLGWQRLRLVDNRRKELEAKLELEVKDRELEQQRREMEMLAQAKLLEILKVTIEVEDRERSRISHDLHDRVGAQIGAVKHLFGRLMEDLGTSDATLAQSLLKVNQGLQGLMAEVRAVAHDLESPTLIQFGLEAALKGFKDMFEHIASLEFELDVHGLHDRLDVKQERNIYLILKELFNNAIHRGQATSFSIQLVGGTDSLTMLVEDNGCGFDMQDPEFRMGLGLRSIQNRVQILGGEMSVDSQLGRGTIFTIEIPLESNAL